ncbi:unnamed protein product [Tilletia controversa]|nr:unnamed protein product [Tilletia controversa]
MITLAPLLSSSAHPSLLDDIKEAQQSDDAAQPALVSDDPHYAQQDDLIMYDGRVYIPPAGNLRQRVVAAVHDSLPAGHPGPARTIELLRRTHDFPGSRRFVRTDVPAADDLVSTIRQIHQELRIEIQHAQEQQRRFYDRHRAPPPRLQEGQHVWLLRRNIRTTRPMDKLDHKRLGPFVIEQRVSENAYRLRLPPTLSRLHPVFNVQLLEPYIAFTESMRARPTPQQLRVQLNDADIHDLPWRPVQQIMDVRKIGNRFDYLLRWHGLDSTSPFLVSAPALSSVPIPPPLPVPASDPSSLAAPPSSVSPPPAPPVPPPTAPTAHYRLRRVPRLNYRE